MSTLLHLEGLPAQSKIQLPFLAIKEHPHIVLLY